MRQLRWPAAVGALWVAGYATAAALLAEHPGARQILADVVYLVPAILGVVLAVAVCRRVTGTPRRVWRLLAVSAVLGLSGEVAWAFQELVLGQKVPSPSVADAFYLTAYLPVPFAIVCAFGRAPALRRARALLDTSPVTVAVGLVGWRLLIAPQLSAGLDPATAAAVAYALADLVILATLVSFGFAGHRRIPGSLALVALSYLVGIIGNSGATWLSLPPGYAVGSWPEILWQAQLVLLCLAALTALRPQEREAEVTLLGRDLGLGPSLLAAGCTLALVAADLRSGTLSSATAVVGTAVLAGILLRLWLTGRDKDRVARELDRALREQEPLAVTDGLTELYNRRFFEEVLRLEAERATRAGGPLSVLVVDLDRFKRINDTHGHEAGDAVLQQVARRLTLAIRPSDVLARNGGEEFVVLLPGADAEVAQEVAERVRRSIAEQPFTLSGRGRGDTIGLQVTASVGGAAHPAHTARPEELIHVADRALHSAKAAGRNRSCMGAIGDQNPVADGQAGVVTLLERVADLIDARQGPDEHSTAVGRWAGVLADALGLPTALRQRLQLAGRFHDIGKLAVADTILQKPGPLDDAEWALMRAHTAVGARLLDGLPELDGVAQVVFDHHERPDGRGYPRALQGSAVSLEVRVVSVCDAWAAMRARRHYGSPLSREDARRELESGRGTQFDAEIVDTFLSLEAAGVIGTLGMVQPSDPAPSAAPRVAAAVTRSAH